MDARKLAELLRTGMLRPVYHGENGLRTLRELGRVSDNQTDNPSKNVVGLDVSHHTHVLPRGGEKFIS